MAAAAQRDVIALPLAGNKIRHGARLEIETRWPLGSGYRPVKVTVVNMPAGKTKFDRDFRVCLTPAVYYNAPATVRTEAIIEMPEGSTEGSAWISVPQTIQWTNLAIEVYEGGEKIPELSIDSIGLSSMGSRYWAGRVAEWEAIPTVLFIDADTPDAATRQRMLTPGAIPPVNTYALPNLHWWANIAPQPHLGMIVMPIKAESRDNLPARQADLDVLRTIENIDTIEILPPNELPDRWRDYSSLDLIVISLPDLEELTRDYPQRWEAIRRWVGTGPTLVVYDVGKKFQRLEALDKLLGGAPDRDERPADELADHPGWTHAKREHASTRIRLLDQLIDSQYRGWNSQGVTPGVGLPATMTENPPFAIRRYGLGRVAAMTADDPLRLSESTDPGSDYARIYGAQVAVPEENQPPAGVENYFAPNEMKWLLNQLDTRNWMTYQRTGMSTAGPNSDFMTFLIAGTGRVPVWSFLFLISLFVVLIGPLNYYLLLRWKRLFLLLVTVPAGAAVVTMALFSYAIISDGLGVRMRARSFTRLDQRSGEATTWARQSYYAGLAPSGGLSFSGDAVVMPIEERPWQGRGRVRSLHWSDEEQQLRSGYISARQTAQFLVISTHDSERKLEVSRAADGAPRVTNQLGAKIAHLLLRDREGNYFQAKGIEAQAEATLAPVDYIAGSRPLVLAYGQAQPSSPEGYDTEYYGGGLFGFTNSGRQYAYISYGNQLSVPNPHMGTSVLETELRRTATNTGDSELLPGSYVALLESSPEMPIGYKHVEEQGSLHILEGRW